MDNPTRYDFASPSHIAHLTRRLATCEGLRHRARKRIPTLEALTRSLRDELEEAQDAHIRREKEAMMAFDFDFVGC